jgi:hypothetical protein
MFRFKEGDRVTRRDDNSKFPDIGTIIECISGTGFNYNEYVVEFPYRILDDHFKVTYQENELNLYIDTSHGCECGALKVFGAQCTRLHHALYCRLRGNVDDEK